MRAFLKFSFRLLGIFLLAALALWLLWPLTERWRIHSAAIKSAHLAPVPDSKYKAWTLGNMFSRSYVIAFTCSDAEFKKFVSSSPGLQEVVPYRFPYSETDPTPTTWDKPPEYTREFMRDADAFWRVDPNQSPKDKSFWDHTKARRKGRHYEIVIPDESIHGWLLRDDDSGQVLLGISYS